MKFDLIQELNGREVAHDKKGKGKSKEGHAGGALNNLTRVRARSVSWAIETDGDDVNLVLCRIVERPSGFDPARLTHFITDSLDFAEFDLIQELNGREVAHDSVSWAIETDGDDVNLVLCRIVERPSGVTFLALALTSLRSGSPDPFHHRLARLCRV
jgi:endonuclease V-like protein UPF0215 family